MKKDEHSQSTNKKTRSQGVPSKGSTDLKCLAFCHIPQAVLLKVDMDHMDRTHVVAGGSSWLHTGSSLPLQPGDKVVCKTTGLELPEVCQNRGNKMRASVTMTVEIHTQHVAVGTPEGRECCGFQTYEADTVRAQIFPGESPEGKFLSLLSLSSLSPLSGLLLSFLSSLAYTHLLTYS